MSCNSCFDEAQDEVYPGGHVLIENTPQDSPWIWQGEGRRWGEGARGYADSESVQNILISGAWGSFLGAVGTGVAWLSVGAIYAAVKENTGTLYDPHPQKAAGTPWYLFDKEDIDILETMGLIGTSIGAVTGFLIGALGGTPISPNIFGAAKAKESPHPSGFY